jgi:hypothetical protein
MRYSPGSDRDVRKKANERNGACILPWTGSLGAWDYHLKTSEDVWFGKAHAQLGMTPDEAFGSRKEFWERVHEGDREPWSTYYK